MTQAKIKELERVQNKNLHFHLWDQVEMGDIVKMMCDPKNNDWDFAKADLKCILCILLYITYIMYIIKRYCPLVALTKRMRSESCFFVIILLACKVLAWLGILDDWRMDWRRWWLSFHFNVTTNTSKPNSIGDRLRRLGSLLELLFRSIANNKFISRNCTTAQRCAATKRWRLWRRC